MVWITASGPGDVAFNGASMTKHVAVAYATDATRSELKNVFLLILSDIKVETVVFLFLL